MCSHSFSLCYNFACECGFSSIFLHFPAYSVCVLAGNTVRTMWVRSMFPQPKCFLSPPLTACTGSRSCSVFHFSACIYPNECISEPIFLQARISTFSYLLYFIYSSSRLFVSLSLPMNICVCVCVCYPCSFLHAVCAHLYKWMGSCAHKQMCQCMCVCVCLGWLITLSR